MKIRTDFVTNSSSSSYCVQIIAEDDRDRIYLLEADGDAAAGYGLEDEDAIHPQISCPAETLAEAKGLQELQELLVKNSKGISKKKVQKWIEGIRSGAGDLDHLRKITLKRFLVSWGEGSGPVSAGRAASKPGITGKCTRPKRRSWPKSSRNVRSAATTSARNRW